jgi:proline racemase
MAGRPYETDLEIETIDTHTAGEPTRIVVDGVEALPGDSVREKTAVFERRHDHIRRLLMQEPRGHADMFGAVVVEPTVEAADLGVFFMDPDRYGDMCGHAVIGVVTAFIETGRLDPAETVTLETPAGLVDAYPTVEDGTVTEVAVRNVDAFVYDTVTVPHGELGSVDVDVLYSGIDFAMVDLEPLGLPVDADEIDRFRTLGEEILAGVNDRIDADRLADEAVDAVQFYRRDDDGVERAAILFGDDLQVDRSPCGTGTCAKATLRYVEGDLDVDESFVQESPIGTRFLGRVVSVAERDGRTVVTAEVSGSASITGEHTFVKRPNDPVDGFVL